MKSILIVSAFVATCFSGVAQYSGKAAEIDKLMTSASANGFFNGAIMVADKGKVIYNKGFGMADLKTSDPVTENSIFNLCSIGKQFTAMGIMMLKEQGKLNYDDSLSRYFPELPYKGITLRHLLHHTSGLPDYFELIILQWHESRIATNKDAIALLAKHQPAIKFLPGEKHEYCNTGYMLLASIIEKVSKQTYEQFMKTSIFSKVGMNKTYLYLANISKVKPLHYAVPYAYDFGSGKFVPDEFEPYKLQVTKLDGTYGDGGLYSCTSDMILWDNVLKTEKLVKKPTMQEAFTSGKLNNGQPITPVGYGFGWFIVSDPVQGNYIQHTGGWPGFRQAFIRYLDKDRTLLILRNNEVTFAGIQKAIENILDGKPYDIPKTSLAYELTSVATKGSAADIRRKFEEVKNTSIANESELNLAGYSLLGFAKIEPALELMKINTELFPQSFNAFDSLGEVYLKMGDKTLAKENYRKSLELNPANENAKQVLEKLY